MKGDQRRAEERRRKERKREEKGEHIALETSLTSGGVLKWLLEWTLSLRCCRRNAACVAKAYGIKKHIRKKYPCQNQREREFGKIQQKNVNTLVYYAVSACSHCLGRPV